MFFSDISLYFLYHPQYKFVLIERTCEASTKNVSMGKFCASQAVLFSDKKMLPEVLTNAAPEVFPVHIFLLKFLAAFSGWSRNVDMVRFLVANDSTKVTTGTGALFYIMK